MTTSHESTLQQHEQEIDFLPAHYREHTAKKKGRAWRLTTIVLIAMMLPVASFYQLRVRAKLQRELDTLRPQCVTVDAYRAQLQTLDKKRLSLESKARLIAYLHHPWPRSQILSALLPTLPQSVALTSIQIEEMAGTAIAAAPIAKNPHQEVQVQAAEVLPADADLKYLRDRHDPAQVVVLLSGVTTDQSQLHEYLGKLARNRLFVKTELLSLESPSSKQAAGKNTEGDQFRARLIVCQGPGQPDGPKSKGDKDGSIAGANRTTVVAGRVP
ncbi:MAG: hypothetical protein K8T91_16790 [Planctomycetes bacterium]|nr:hypothetical protein [Planctomycetota bacterium]